MDYISSHLEYMLFEVLKNAVRAQVEAHPAAAMPPIRADVVRQGALVHIAVEDDGKGAAKDRVDRIFRYSYIPPSERNMDGKPVARLGGQGYGVAHSKLYARYLQVSQFWKQMDKCYPCLFVFSLQGDMFFESTLGRGTCVRLALQSDPSLAVEKVPVLNSAAKRQYENPCEKALDWHKPRKPVQQLRSEQQPFGLL